MRSMTGFGTGSAVSARGKIVLTLRALNHRFQDVRVRASGALAPHAFFIETLVRERLGRGRYDVAARLESSAERGGLDRKLVTRLFAELAELRDQVAPDAPLDFATVARLAAALPAEELEDSELEAPLEAAFTIAARELTTMRAREGRTLAKDLAERTSELAALRQSIATEAPDLVLHQRRRLSERLARLLEDSGAALAPERFEQEVALLADKSDITEELVRLGSHLEQFRALLSIDEPMGRKLDFVVQEMGRELNTIGSKATHTQVAQLVITAKAELERIREQVQNIE